jgi:acetyl-CoA acyltransferase
MKEAVIVSAVRSPVGKGKKDGALAGTHPAILTARVIAAAVEKSGMRKEDIDDVILGCAMPEASQGLNMARLATLKAGLPVETSATTVNRFCSSGLQTIALGAQGIMTEMIDSAVVGGFEMMSQVPMSGYHTRLHPELTESYIGMGFTAERVAERWKVSRQDQDGYALESQRKAAVALQKGVFAGEIVPIDVEQVTWNGAEKQERTITIDRDELPRPDTTIEGLAKLKPAFKANGTVTAGNASPYSDGAAALVMTSREKAEAEGLTILARLVHFATSGVDPDIMGIAPIKAVPKVLKRAGMSLADIDLIEMNEAFAAQALAVARVLEMDMDKLNVNGGAIALGHPLGATGGKLATQLIHELRRRGGGMGLVTMCVGGGMGAAGIFEVYGG